MNDDDRDRYVVEPSNGTYRIIDRAHDNKPVTLLGRPLAEHTDDRRVADHYAAFLNRMIRELHPIT